VAFDGGLREIPRAFSSHVPNAPPNFDLMLTKAISVSARYVTRAGRTRSQPYSFTIGFNGAKRTASVGRPLYCCHQSSAASRFQGLSGIATATAGAICLCSVSVSALSLL